MKETSPGVLIIGGGVAGMAAAQVLSDFDIPVHVVEKQDRLGGHSVKWACMATESCVNCGACLSIEMVDNVMGRQNITPHFGAGILSVNRSGNGFDVTLQDGKTLSVQKIIAATGFSPFDPEKIGSYHTGTLENVITTARLNTLLQKEGVGEFLAGNPAPDIAFVQCVGSRNRKIGNDYCSQVCCKVAMRHANKLLHVVPDAHITIFYMDLQLIGKETRSFYEALAPNVELVQGVPAEILEGPENGKLRIVTEDRNDMTRIARQFDMVVLSVGMEPSAGMEDTADITGLSPNAWGFFNTGEAALAKDVYVAGCARTPGDILSSMQDGRIVAGRVLEDMGIAGVRQETGGKKDMQVAVFGEGGQAASTAAAVAKRGYDTFLFGADVSGNTAANLHAMADAKILQVSGTAGNFRIYYEQNGRKETLSCTAIIAAHEPHVTSKDIGVSSENIIDPARFSDILSDAAGNGPADIVVLLDYSGPECKKWARTALEDAIKAKSLGKNVSIIARKMLVHKADGQRLFDAARKKGVSFLRYEKPEDIVIEKTEKGFALAMKEATLPSSLDVRLDCDCLVLPPTIEAPADFQSKAAVLRQQTDAEGFLQSPNVRHRLTSSTRKGIFFAGTGHDEADADDLDVEIDDILTFLATRPFDLPEVDTGVVINEKMCAKCLTCYRICPHGAIVLTEKMKPRIVPDACFSCHLCVANCPAHAIESEAFANDAFSEMAEKDQTVIFACERSAYLAAAETALPDNVRLVKIPCTSRINMDVILKCLLKGASKIIIAGCHEGNCRSMEGTREAARGVRQTLRIPGMDDSRVVFAPVAANEPEKIKRMVSKA
ncbi:MAG: hydrogenase iron-sulfur subunit [Desulfosalsimonadaceae bacterium]